MENKATKLTDTAGKESGEAQNTLKQLSDLEKKLPKPLTVVNMDSNPQNGFMCVEERFE